MLPFQGLKSVVSRIRFKDESALKGLGLTKLVRTYDAYPLKEGARRIFCLLPRGVSPSVAQKMEFDTAVRQIVVLEDNGRGLSRIWPVPESLNQGQESPRSGDRLQTAERSGDQLQEKPSPPQDINEPVLEILDE